MSVDTATQQHAPDPERARRISRLWPLVSGSVALLAAVALGALILIRGNLPFEADAEWMEEILEHRSPLWEVPSLVMNFLGGGWFGIFVVPIGVVVALCLLRRFWAALYFVLTVAVSAGVVQALKALYNRPRPEDILVISDIGSFPSGHVANAATLAVALGIIFWRVWVWAAGVAWVVLMLLSRTYLGAHWLSDTLGGILVGVAVGIVVWAPFANKLRVESSRVAQ